MKIREIVTPALNQLQPTALQQQARINQVIQQIAAADQKRPPNAAEIAMAHQQYEVMKQKNDAAYAEKVRKRAIQSKMPREGGRLKR